jgi:hypothetical protein
MTQETNMQKFTKIDRVLKTTAKNYKLEKAVQKHKLLKVWQEVVSGFVEGAEKATQAFDFQKGVLSVACLSKEIAYQIKVLSQRIIYALNQVIGFNAVFALQVEY